ncbi:MAG TPA: hypothetical protein VGR16_10375 [Thermomicrobiales bacterium]|nr:hypothetical protein [Thermomicrobiales bacterium]
MVSSDRPPDQKKIHRPAADREPATAILPDLTDLFDRRIDPQRRGEHDRRTLPDWAVPASEPADESHEPAAYPPLPLVGTPTFRFDRSRQGFAAVVARPLGMAFVLSAPLLLSGILALAASGALWRLGTNALPVTMLGLFVFQVAGLTMARGVGYLEWAPVWLILVAALGVLAPLLALQALFGGAPFVSVELASAGPFVASTLGVGLALLAVTLGVALLSREEPERASILFLPVALLVPALLGMSPDVVTNGVLKPLGTALLAAGVWSLVAWLAPRGIWLLTTPIALAAELILLLVTDGGPRAGEQAGTVVAVGYGSVLALTVIAGVSIPLLARWTGRITGGRAR